MTPNEAKLEMVKCKLQAKRLKKDMLKEVWAGGKRVSENNVSLLEELWSVEGDIRDLAEEVLRLGYGARV